MPGKREGEEGGKEGPPPTPPRHPTHPPRHLPHSDTVGMHLLGCRTAADHAIDLRDASRRVTFDKAQKDVLI